MYGRRRFFYLVVKDGIIPLVPNETVLGHIDQKIKSLVLELHWTNKDIDGLYLDDIDRFGLMYWYNVIEKNHEEIKKIMPK